MSTYREDIERIRGLMPEFDAAIARADHLIRRVEDFLQGSGFRGNIRVHDVHGLINYGKCQGEFRIYEYEDGEKVPWQDCTQDTKIALAKMLPHLIAEIEKYAKDSVYSANVAINLMNDYFEADPPVTPITT